MLCGALAPPGAQSLKQGGICCFHPRTFTAVTLAGTSRPPGCLPSGRHLAHRDAPLAAIDGFDPGGLTQADQGSPVIGVLAQQALELQLVQQVALNSRPMPNVDSWVSEVRAFALGLDIDR